MHPFLTYLKTLVTYKDRSIARHSTGLLKRLQEIDTEWKTFDNADVCESADDLLAKVCQLLNISIPEHDEDTEESYSAEIQPLFNVIHDHIEELLEEIGLTKE